MTDQRDSSMPQYVLGTVWHLIDGPGAAAPREGHVYFVKCYRWMRASGAQIIRGALPRNEQLCRSCESIAAKPMDHPTDRVIEAESVE